MARTAPAPPWHGRPAADRSRLPELSERRSAQHRPGEGAGHGPAGTRPATCPSEPDREACEPRWKLGIAQPLERLGIGIDAERLGLDQFILGWKHQLSLGLEHCVELRFDEQHPEQPAVAEVLTDAGPADVRALDVGG